MVITPMEEAVEGVGSAADMDMEVMGVEEEEAAMEAAAEEVEVAEGVGYHTFLQTRLLCFDHRFGIILDMRGFNTMVAASGVLAMSPTP